MAVSKKARRKELNIVGKEVNNSRYENDIKINTLKISN